MSSHTHTRDSCASSRRAELHATEKRGALISTTASGLLLRHLRDHRLWCRRMVRDTAAKRATHPFWPQSLCEWIGNHRTRIYPDNIVHLAIAYALFGIAFVIFPKHLSQVF